MLHPLMPMHRGSADNIVDRHNADALPIGEPTSILRASAPRPSSPHFVLERHWGPATRRRRRRV